MTLPQLPREPIRPNLLSEIDKEIWQPNWGCYCCHDTGLVREILVLLVIPDYDKHKDRLVACQRSGCEASFNFRLDSHYDQRFNPSICAELDKISRDDWKQTVLAQHELAKNRAAIKDSAAATNWRSRDRTLEEDIEAQRRSKEIKCFVEEENAI